MENLIRTAVFEISQIFEDSLHDHQVELARKGEEIAYLKIKLQRAELRLKEVSSGSGQEQTLNQSFQIPKASEESAPLEEAAPVSSPTPEESFEFELPDDWCVPLESETVSKPENPCPSVRLKQFSIRLCPIPLKHEAFSKLDMSMLRHRHCKDTSRRGLQEETKPKRGRGRPRMARPGLIHGGLKNVKEEPFAISVEQIKRGRGRPKGTTIRKVEIPDMNGTQGSPSKFIYTCRFCPKVFDTAFGLSVHHRAHKKCQGCKRIFPFPSVLGQHKTKCKYYKKLKLSSGSPNETKSNAEQKDTLRKPKISDRKRNLFTCKSCQKRFDNRSKMLHHPCFTSCQLCHIRLYRMALAGHMGKYHNSPKGVTGQTDTSWKKPLIKMGESQDAPLSPFESAKKYVEQCPKGFRCLICKNVYSAKHTAIEHVFKHTGEKPFKCPLCPRQYSQRSNLSLHRRKFHGVILRKVMKCTCSKKFLHKSKFKEHKLTCPKAGK